MSSSVIQTAACSSRSTYDQINILEIYAHILFFTDLSTQANLMRTSRLWYSIVAPILYRDLIYNIHGVQSGIPKDSFAILPPPSLDPSSSSNGLVNTADLEKAKRISKIELMRNCRILRVYPHSTTGLESDIDCPASQLNIDGYLNPETLVLQMYEPDRLERLGDHHLDIGCDFGYEDSNACALVRNLNPKKLVIKDWYMACPEKIEGLPNFTSVESTVVLVSKGILTRPNDCTCAYRPVLSGHYGNGFWYHGEGNPPISSTIIFQGIQEASMSDIIPKKEMPLHWIRICAEESLHYLVELEDHSVTFVNPEGMHFGFESEESLLESLNSETPTFLVLFKSYFFDVEWMEIPVDDVEEAWSRVKFMSKEEYMDKDPKELEGELDDVEW